MSILGISIFGWPIVLLGLVLLFAPAAGDIALVLAIPILASFAVGTGLCLVALSRAITTLKQHRRGEIALSARQNRRHKRAVAIGLTPAVLVAITLFSLYGTNIH